MYVYVYVSTYKDMHERTLARTLAYAHRLSVRWHVRISCRDVQPKKATALRIMNKLTQKK